MRARNLAAVALLVGGFSFLVTTAVALLWFYALAEAVGASIHELSPAAQMAMALLFLAWFVAVLSISLAVGAYAQYRENAAAREVELPPAVPAVLPQAGVAQPTAHQPASADRGFSGSAAHS